MHSNILEQKNMGGRMVQTKSKIKSKIKSHKKSRREIESDAFALIREFEATLEYLDVRIRRMREKTAEIKKELIQNRADMEAD